MWSMSELVRYIDARIAVARNTNTKGFRQSVTAMGWCPERRTVWSAADSGTIPSGIIGRGW